MIVGFQGEKGAYSEKAAKKYFEYKSIVLKNFETFRDIFEALKRNEIEYAVIPIENSLAGSVHENYDLMLEYKYHIIGEEIIRINHNLIGIKGAKLKDIKEVYSHPQALSQCSNFFKKHKNIKKIPFYDTAGAVKMVKELNDKTKAAIASEQAAIDYDMEILASSIENDKNNYTRFLIITKQGLKNLKKEEGVVYKTSIVFSLKSIPGALFKSLSVFALREINLLKIESRPLIGTPWKYLFYLDFEGFYKDKLIKRALNNLSEVAENIYIFGSYKKKNF